MRLISFGTLRNPRVAVAAAHELAESTVDPGSANWQATGDQRRSYYFEEAGREVPYRMCVPTGWDGESELPLVMFLHGAG